MSEFWQMVAVVGLVLISVYTRSFFFLSNRPWPFPAWVEQGLRYAPIGALAAVAVPAVVLDHGALPQGWMDARAIAGVAAVAFAIWRKDMLLTIVVGMVVFHLVKWATT